MLKPIQKIKLSENILLLQGPVGSFFRKFSYFCKSNGSTNVHKINFSLGESIFHLTKKSTLYTGSLSDWENYLENFINKHTIQQIFLLSDARPIHTIAVKVAKRIGIPVFVFEQGYIRPNRITIELYGVNGNSQLPKNPEEYLPYATIKAKTPFTLFLKTTRTYLHYFGFYVITTPIYIFFSFLTLFLNPKACELLQFPIKSKKELIFYPIKWIMISSLYFIGPLMKLVKYYKITKNNKWAKSNNKKFFILLLQVPSDSQIQRDSNFNDMYDVINKVLISFKKNSSKDHKLLIKHHPIDKFFNNYKNYIFNKCLELQIPIIKVKYIHDIHLPTAFNNSLATITVNSTSGFSAILHNNPVICLSNKAIYDIVKLTYQGSLDNFWHDALNFKIDVKLRRGFYNYLDYHIHIIGSGFWGPFTKNRFHEMFYIKTSAKSLSRTHQSTLVAKKASVKSYLQ